MSNTPRIEKIDLSKMRGQFNILRKDKSGIVEEAGDDTEQSLQTIAAKVNEIIERLEASNV